jgi:hypothetical protein
MYRMPMYRMHHVQGAQCTGTRHKAQQAQAHLQAPVVLLEDSLCQYPAACMPTQRR